MNSALLPFAITCTALYLGLGLFPFTPAGIGWPEAIGLLPDRLTVDGWQFSALFLALPLGFFWQGAAWPRATSVRAAASAGVFLGLCLLTLLMQLGQIHFPPRLTTSAGLLLPALGFAAGMTLWWLFGPALSRRPSILPAWLWPVSALSAALLVLLPLNLEALLVTPALPGGVSVYVTDIPQRLYLLIKSAILWVPVGFIFALAGRGAALPRWGIALVVAVALEGLLLLRELPLRELLELLFALPGMWLGAWLGERSLVQQAPAAMTSAHRPQRAMAAAIAEPSAVAPNHGTEIPLPATEPESSMAEPTHSRRHRHHSGSKGKPHDHPLRILAGLLLLLAAGVGLLVFPLWQAGIALGLTVYMVALWIWPMSWLLVVPAALPLLDLAPWTGRFFFDEFDLLMLLTAATVFLRGRKWPRTGLTSLWPLLTLCSAAVLISTLLGLGSAPDLDANAFSSYWSNYNSLRVLKGFLWGGLIFMLLRLSRPEPEQLATRLTIGMGIGLLGVGLVGLWERWLFAGFANDEHTYRIVSTFSSMHTGGGHIEAFLAAALPFLWLGMARLPTLLLAVPVMALTVYVTIFTVARGGALALGVVLTILAVASLRLAWNAGQRRQAALPIGILSLLAAGLLAGIGGGYFQQRLAQSGEDWQIRMDHWQNAISMMDATPMAQLFGMGLGSFPRTYLERGPVDKQPATFGFMEENDNTFLRLGSGDTLYYAQRVAVRAGENYQLELDVRSQEGESIEVPVCEKQLLNSRRCVWITFNVPGDGQWHRLDHVFPSGEVGVEDGLQRPPVDLFLYYPGKSGVIDVDNIRLLDAKGGNLLGNGTFTWGGDYWFFKTHSHLPWHIKNVWVHVLFEHGWLGLLLFTSLAGFALFRLAGAAWRGQRLAWAWLASLLGLLTVGMFDSLLDTPRLATLLVALSLLGAGYEWDAVARPSRRRRRSRRPHATPSPTKLETPKSDSS